MARSRDRRSPAWACVWSWASASISRRAGEARALVGDRERFVVGDSRFAAIALADAVAPRAAVEVARRGEVLPDIRAAGDAAVHVVDELLAHETRHIEKVRRDL